MLNAKQDKPFMRQNKAYANTRIRKIVQNFQLSVLPHYDLIGRNTVV